jgi:hypothetical protein
LTFKKGIQFQIFGHPFIDQTLIRLAGHAPPIRLIFQTTSTWSKAASSFKARAQNISIYGYGKSAFAETGKTPQGSPGD